jgi:ADP-ribosyl-[dinitrogen reductase] hydrolase
VTIRSDTILGGLIGCAVGDAIGLPREGLSAQRAARLFPVFQRYYFLGTNGATSDDFDHACMTVESLAASKGDSKIFAHELARRIRTWAVCVPGGIGLATLRASIKLCLGYGPEHSGVFSAGNGPAMRSYVIGVYSQDTKLMIELVRASTRITHIDRRAFTGALVIALAGRCSAYGSDTPPDVFLKQARELLTTAEADDGFLLSIEEVVDSVKSGEATTQFAQRYGRDGVSGYIYHTVPVVIHAWLSHPLNLENAIKSVVDCGGDTDTTGAIVGGIVGARVGIKHIPAPWIDKLLLWPRGFKRTSQLATAVGNDTSQICVPAWQYLLRNLWFNPLVLLHGLRRLAPPY